MTTISKLCIQGIRSFDHEEPQLLEFEKPVTLIVGPNGSGKTTIIECLKMASAGVLPPNAKNGHGWVHDLQVARLPEVKAQIRLQFNSGGRDQDFIAIRSFQLTNKKTAGKMKQQYKAVESLLWTTAEDGSRASLSHRCADMDTQVPELMGVSRAVLENVIFCHQEESSWPLQDAASVKKRFDDIFGATRYTKALQNVKDLQRDWTKVTRERRAEADLSQAHLDQATKISAQREDRERQAREIAAELEGLGEQVAASNEAMQRIELEVGQYESRGVRVAELRSLIGRIGQDQQDVKRSMDQRGQDVFSETFEELQKQSQEFIERRIPEAEQKAKQARALLTAGESEYHSAIATARKLREDMGETVAAAELLASRKAELAGRLSKGEVGSVKALRERLDGLAADFARVEQEQRQRDATAEEALAQAERAFREASLEASRNEARVEDARAAVKRLEEESKTLMRAGPDLDTLVRSMHENEAALGAEGSDARLRRLEGRQEEIGRRRHDLQYSVTRKSSEVAQLEAQSDAHVEVDALRRRVREAEAELGQKLGDARPRLVGLLGQMPEASEAVAKVLAESQKAEEQLQRQRQKCQEAHQRENFAAATRRSAEADLQKLREEEQRLAGELGAPPAAAEGDASADFAARLAAQQEQVALARKDLSMTESAKHMYEKFRDKSRGKNTCQFCRRPFCTGDELAAFEDTVERLIVKIPAFLEESTRRFDEAQAELLRLDAQRPRWEYLKKLRLVEIPNRQKEVASQAERERAAQAALEPEEREKRRLEERAHQLQDTRAEAAELQRGAATAEELRTALRAKEARLLGANSKVSLQAERDQLRALQEQLCELGREEDAVRAQRDLLARQQEQLRTQLAEQKGRLQLLQAQVARRGDVESELVARQSDVKECSEAAKRARDTAEAAGVRSQNLRQERSEAAARFRSDLDRRDAEVRAQQREVDALTEIERSIEIMQGRVENVDRLKAELEAADNTARTAERDLEGLRQKVEEHEDRRRKREAMRECLQANLRLKGLEGEAKKHETEIAELLKDLGGRDVQALRQDLEAARARSLELQRQQAYRDGELKQTREAAKTLEMELASPLYNGVEARHREAIIKHESAAYAAKDLGRYHAALDKALMKFHTMKMAEINKTVRELWQKVYRGRDIDYVAVRSDTEEAEGQEGGGAVPGESTAGRALRSYNYRVVMVCGDAEMDMRGRCSAGQRVLCSLIIRLALASSFCSNCGVLALDEPTTNLDAANIGGLAEALANLIEQRRRHSRFQLILITHDEAFVAHLCRLQVCDWYWYLQKDDRGCSKINRRDIRTWGT